MVVMREKDVIVTINSVFFFFFFFFCLSKKRALVMMRWYDLPVSAGRGAESPVGSLAALN